jgi:hypothetical protein
MRQDAEIWYYEYRRICLTGLTETMKILSKDGPWPSRNSTGASPKYKYGAWTPYQLDRWQISWITPDPLLGWCELVCTSLKMCSFRFCISVALYSLLQAENSLLAEVINSTNTTLFRNMNYSMYVPKYTPYYMYLKQKPYLNQAFLVKCHNYFMEGAF